MSSTKEVLPLSAATKIASYQLLPPNGLAIEVAQATHRINLINSWSVIQPGSRVLEIGCGQGNCTAVLAEAVGPTGHVDAVDPAPANYGAPFTLAQAQQHISDNSEIGNRITWHRASPEEFLRGREEEEEEKTWDVAILTHCIWYFKSPSVLGAILDALKGRVQKVCIAEYALRATEAKAVPHVLATLARGTLEAHKSKSSQNIQTPLSPNGIRNVAKAGGWTLEGESWLVPEEGLADGYWETSAVVSESFQREIDTGVDSDRVKVVLESARASVLAAVEAAGGVKSTRTMDVWAGVFSTSTTQ